jgi:hypothetical protein
MLLVFWAKAKNRRIPDGFIRLSRSAGLKLEDKAHTSLWSIHIRIKRYRSRLYKQNAEFRQF